MTKNGGSAMKRLICCMLITALLIAAAAPAYAAVPTLGPKMISYAKAALKCLAAGDYERVVTGLPFSGLSPSAEEWRSFAQGAFTGLSGSSPQTKYAVAFWTGRAWRVCVPVSEPNSGGVDTLVLSSEDGSTFTGYGCTSWDAVRAAYQSADYVAWDAEYSASTSAIVENDE